MHTLLLGSGQPAAGSWRGGGGARLRGSASLSPGASVRVLVPTGPDMTAVVVPVSALRRGPAGDHVFVLAPDDKGATRAHVRPVASGPVIGDQVVILGHHYQRDQVIGFADARGDSFELSRFAAAADAPHIVFCGVHFMAESASILARPDQTVILPDLAAGCSMADMAQHHQLVDAWARLERAGAAESTVPLTYMNSTAAIKAFCGERGGAICTSSNAPRAMQWAFEQGERVLFLPDQHLGRNTAVLSLGLSLDDCVVYDPWKPDGGLTDAELRDAKVVLWKGHCSVHARFQPHMVERVRRELPGVEVLVHPECRHEVVLQADRVGSTSQILRWVEEAPAGSRMAIATELNLVKRLGQDNPDKQVVFLDDTVCFCATMNRIDLPHLTWVLEALVDGVLWRRPPGEPPERLLSDLGEL